MYDGEDEAECHLVDHEEQGPVNVGHPGLGHVLTEVYQAEQGRQQLNTARKE